MTEPPLVPVPQGDRLHALARERERFQWAVLGFSGTALALLGPIFAATGWSTQATWHNAILLALTPIGAAIVWAGRQGRPNLAIGLLAFGALAVSGGVHLSGHGADMALLYLMPVLVVGWIAGDSLTVVVLPAFLVAGAAVIRALRWDLGIDDDWGLWWNHSTDALAVLALTGVLTWLGRRRMARNESVLQQVLWDRQRLADKARAASDEKSAFLARVSHELRTPLNAVLGFAQMLQYDPKTPLTSSQEESVGNIIEGGQHLLELVNDILDLVRIEAHQVSLSVQKVDANEIVKNCVDLSLPLGQPNGVEIIDGLSDRAPFLLRADEVRLKQILLNLLSNAVKYNRPNGKVVVDGWETKNKFLRLEVSDTGIGITKEDFQGVFEVFQRIDADPMVAREGTGIGLSVSKLLVEKMAGRIGFESELGVGSTFWVELPLASKRDVLIWGDTMRTGNDQIDRDHQVLVALLNKTAQNDIKEAQVDDVLSELVEYTHKHFRREEKIMKLCGYPELDKHCRIHEKLSSQVQSLSDQWQHNRSEENLDALRLFLRDWLFDHIINVDTKLTAYISGPKKNS